jgi:hypothetical protein
MFVRYYKDFLDRVGAAITGQDRLSRPGGAGTMRS